MINRSYILKFILILSFLTPFICNAQDKKPTGIKGIVLLTNKDSLLDTYELKKLEGIDTSRINLPGSTQSLEKKLSPFLNDQPWDEQTLRAIKQQIYEYYQHNEYPFILILIPSQNKKSQVLQLIIIESRMKQLKVNNTKGNCYRNLINYFKTKPGDLLNQRRINKDLNFMNRNPFRQVNIVFTPGSENYTTDITLCMNTRKPYRLYAGVDNSGVTSTGRQRIFMGLDWDKVLGFDNCLFYQYTTNYSAHHFHAHTLQYLAFLPAEVILNCYGGFSTLHADLPYPSRKSHGSNIQGSTRIQVPFLPIRCFEHEFSAGFDFKNINNTLEYVDAYPIFGNSVNIFQITAGYKCAWKSKLTIAEIGGELFYSPGHWLPHQSLSNYESLRPEATNRWVRFVAFANYKRFLLKSFAFNLYASGQWSAQTLLPSEQLGLGGYNSVRGYDERQYNADSGLCTSSELHFPSFSFFRSRAALANKLYFLIFLDGGLGVNNTRIPGFKKWDFLISSGLGARFFLGSNLTARCDWGIKLKHEPSFTGGATMLNFSVIASY